MTAEAATVHPFTPRTVLVMVLVGAFTMAAFLVLGSYAPELRSGRDGRAHALSRSAVGFAGLVQLAGDTGLQVTTSRRGVLGQSGDYGDLVILTPEAGRPSDKFQAAIKGVRSEGTTLVVLPKWQVGADIRHPGWVSREGLLPPDVAVAALPEKLRPALDRRKGDGPLRLTATGGLPVAAQGLEVGGIDSLQVLSGEGFTPLLQDDEGHTLLASAPGRPDLLILADPDLLNTQGLRNAARAGLAVDLLDRLSKDQGVVFDVSVNGFSGGRNLIKLALEPPFLAATLCALVAAALMGWHASARFGAPRPSPRALALGKTALADNSAALFRMAGREHRMATPYAELVLHAAARAVGVPRTLDKAEADAMLERLSRKAGAPLPSALLAEAQAVRDTAGLMAVAARLFDFRRRMTRERG